MGDDGQTTDLGRVRRAEQEMEETLREHPEVVERTAQFLGGEPSAEDMESTMAPDRPDKPVRIPFTLIQQIEELLPFMAQDPQFRQLIQVGGQLTVTSALRAVLANGADSLYERYRQDIARRAESGGPAAVLGWLRLQVFSDVWDHAQRFLPAREWHTLLGEPGHPPEGEIPERDLGVKFKAQWLQWEQGTRPPAAIVAALQSWLEIPPDTWNRPAASDG